MPKLETIPAEENALLEKPKTGLRRVVVAVSAQRPPADARGEWNKFSCEVNPGHFTDASVCERHMGIWCDAPP